MCGISAAIFRTGNVAPFLHRALKKLEYRGYDSVGVATIFNNQIYLKKDVGKIDKVHSFLNLDDLPGNIGLGHTRWATHGVPSKNNSHPHLDCKRTIAVVHNGVIDNFELLKRDLIKRGHIFQSETDTEVIPHLIEEFISEGFSLKEAIRKTAKKLKGTFAIVVISTYEPDKIYCIRDGNPLVLGVSNNSFYCASDIPAFLQMTKDVILLHDGELATISLDGISIEKVSDGSPIYRDKIHITWTADMAEKGGFPHFMLKEIHEQPQALRDTFHVKTEIIQKAAELINRSKQVFFVAAGTSGHAGLAGKYLLSKFAGRFTSMENASEFEYIINNNLSDDSLIIAITQSGETLDTINAVKIARKYNSKILSITNVIGSSITSYSDFTIYTQAGPEIGVAATKTFLVQLITLSRLAVELGRLTGILNDSEYKQHINSLRMVPNFVSKIIETEEKTAKSISESLYSKSSFYYLGRGISITTAKEGALKLKEIAYNHAEAYSAGESKHGPIALVEDGFPVVFVVPPDDTYDRSIGNIMEMKARNAEIISVISETDHDVRALSKYFFTVPSDFPIDFSPIGYVVPLQIFSYYMATRKGLDPDKPRNLAKSVTVL